MRRRRARFLHQATGRRDGARDQAADGRDYAITVGTRLHQPDARLAHGHAFNAGNRKD